MARLLRHGVQVHTEEEEAYEQERWQEDHDGQGHEGEEEWHGSGHTSGGSDDYPAGSERSGSGSLDGTRMQTLPPPQGPPAGQPVAPPPVGVQSSGRMSTGAFLRYVSIGFGATFAAISLLVLVYILFRLRRQRRRRREEEAAAVERDARRLQVSARLLGCLPGCRLLCLGHPSSMTRPLTELSRSLPPPDRWTMCSA